MLRQYGQFLIKELKPFIDRQYRTCPEADRTGLGGSSLGGLATLALRSIDEGAFEAEIKKAVVLAMFIPLIISSGGNSGSQASTLVIRALALGEVGLRDWWRVMRREILAGLALGGLLGSIGFMRISIWSTFSNIYGEHWLLVALTVSFALIGIVLWGTLIGSLLPFILRRFGFDPATSSAPFVATLVHVTGLVIYFSVALVILRGTLL
jgi:magnesium transporter